MRETPSDSRSDSRSDKPAAVVSIAQPTFGELLRRYRLVRRLTQAELAERAGLSTRGINDLERGARTAPRRDTVTLLAGALDLSVEERAAFLAAARRPPTIEPRYQPGEAPFQPSEHLLAATSSSHHALLPTGTVTFLFTDIEHSTQILQRLGDRYADALDASQRILRAAFAAHHGREVDTQGDSFFAVFGAAHDALAAAAQAQRALAAERWPQDIPVRVRMGLHTGSPLLVAGHYVGFDVHRAARIGAAAHGGQILLSTATAELARGALDGLPEGAEGVAEAGRLRADLARPLGEPGHRAAVRRRERHQQGRYPGAVDRSFRLRPSRADRPHVGPVGSGSPRAGLPRAPHQCRRHATG